MASAASTTINRLLRLGRALLKIGDTALDISGPAVYMKPIALSLPRKSLHITFERSFHKTGEMIAIDNTAVR